MRIRSILDSSNASNNRNTDVKMQEPVAGASSLSEPAAPGGEGEVLVLNNKTPFWNEVAQVYQLDFGGRVTQESAKNFQIEYRNRQVSVTSYYCYYQMVVFTFCRLCSSVALKMEDILWVKVFLIL